MPLTPFTPTKSMRYPEFATAEAKLDWKEADSRRNKVKQAMEVMEDALTRAMRSDGWVSGLGRARVRRLQTVMDETKARFLAFDVATREASAEFEARAAKGAGEGPWGAFYVLSSKTRFCDVWVRGAEEYQ